MNKNKKFLLIELTILAFFLLSIIITIISNKNKQPHIPTNPITQTTTTTTTTTQTNEDFSEKENISEEDKKMWIN